MTLEDKIKTIADHYGVNLQLTKLAEECAEYSAAFHKWTYYTDLKGMHPAAALLFKEKSDEAGDECLKELADVLVLARQVEHLAEQDAVLKQQLDELMLAKADRQLVRIQEEQHDHA